MDDSRARLVFVAGIALSASLALLTAEPKTLTLGRTGAGVIFLLAGLMMFVAAERSGRAADARARLGAIKPTEFSRGATVPTRLGWLLLLTGAGLLAADGLRHSS